MSSYNSVAIIGAGAWGTALAGVAVRAGLHADERTVEPVHLAALAEVKRLLACHRMRAHHGLRLRALVRREGVWRLAGFGIAAAAAGARLGMQPLQVLHLGLERCRQGVVGERA